MVQLAKGLFEVIEKFCLPNVSSCLRFLSEQVNMTTVRGAS